VTYSGHVRNGVIVLDTPAQLPEGSQVEISPAEQAASEPTWAEVFRDVIGQARDLPADSSLNHDHYLYGTGAH